MPLDVRLEYQPLFGNEPMLTPEKTASLLREESQTLGSRGNRADLISSGIFHEKNFCPWESNLCALRNSIAF